MSLFDLMDVSESQQSNTEPLWKIKLDDKDSEKQILQWVMSELEKIRHENKSRLYEIFTNYKLYKGVSGDRLNRRNPNSEYDDIERVQVQRKLVINHLFDLTEQIVSRVSKYKPAVSILPTNDEFKDKQSSKLSKRLFDQIKYIQGLDDKSRQLIRYSKIAGEGYLFVEWNKDLGEKHPAQSTEEKILFLDENGNPEKDSKNKEIYLDQEIKVGDVEYTICGPEKLFFETTGDINKSKYFFKICEKNVHELRADYPKKANEIRSDDDSMIEQFYDQEKRLMKNSCLVVEMFYKPDKYLPKGRYIKFSPSAILENKDYIYKHGMFPFVRLPDIEVPNEQHAKSFFINARQITAQINNLTTMAMRNIKLMSSPKWMMPKGACKLDELGNNTGVVQYQGGQPPVLVQSNTTPSEVYNFRDALKQDVQQIAGVFGVSRGEPPAGIKAGVALQFLQEQENERMSSYVSKYNESIRAICDLTLKVCSQYYDESDQRTIAILGQDDEYTRVPFDMEALSRSYDIRIQNSSALPESKAQRIQTILDLSERFPSLVSDEQVADLIDFGQSEKWYDEATAATRSAERENELLNEGTLINPQDWEYHIPHWRVHVTELQKPGFMNLPEEIQQLKKDHIMAHEMMMQTQAKKNPLYVEQLKTLRQFPLFFTPDFLSPNPPEEPILNPMNEEGGPEAALAKDKMEQEAQIQAENEFKSLEAERMANPETNPGTMTQ